ncbi:hypothetical protein Pfo_027682 [Paulownia fortunei]|nr:hypothetical protein Pfo_027682 [Paulownia fortunei]
MIDRILWLIVFFVHYGIDISNGIEEMDARENCLKPTKDIHNPSKPKSKLLLRTDANFVRSHTVSQLKRVNSV